MHPTHLEKHFPELCALLDNPRKTLWVGGPPGQTYIKIRERLARVGIDLVAQTLPNKNQFRIPAKVSLIIVNTDMIGHSLSTMVKHEAIRSKTLSVPGSLNTITLIENLQQQHVLPKSVSIEDILAIMTYRKPKESNMKYITKLSNLCTTTFKSNKEQIENFTAFFRPEIDRESKRFLGWFGNGNIPTKIPSNAIQKTLERIVSGKLDPDEEWGTNSLAKKAGFSYEVSRKAIMYLAAGGFICRTAPFHTTKNVNGENQISLNFKFTAKGRAALEVKEVVSPPQSPSKAPIVPAIQPLAKPVERLPSSLNSVSGGKQPNLIPAINMLMDILREEHPEYQKITIDVQAKTYEVEMVATQKFEL